MIVYADAIWFLNVCIDALLLMLTALVLKRRMKRWRLLLASLLASTIVIFAFTPYAAIMTHPVTKLMYSALIVYTAFGFITARVFIQTLLMFYFVTFMIGGGLVGLHFFMQTNTLAEQTVNTRNLSFGDPISWIFVILGFPVMYYFSKKRLAHIEVTEIHYDQIVKVEIQLQDQVLQLNGLIDSGNQLHDPLTQTPVMIVESSYLEGVLPASILAQVNQLQNVPQWEEVESDWAARLRIIPYRAVGQNHGFLLAVKPDEVRIYKKNEVICVTRVFMGLSKTKLSSQQEYACILHPKMLIAAKIISA